MYSGGIKKEEIGLNLDIEARWIVEPDDEI